MLRLIAIVMTLLVLEISATAALQHPPPPDKPKIVGQHPVSTTVEQPVEIHLEDLIVEEETGQYPTGFQLKVHPGKDYHVAHNTVTPKKKFVGVLKVPVEVKKGPQTSNRFDMAVDVLEVQSEPPVITGQVPLTTDANASITIQLSHLTVADPDSDYPQGFSLTVSPGANYSLNGNTVTPNAGFSGTLNVPVVVNDGENNSNSFALQITVNAAANEPPVITGQQSLSTPENTPLTIQLSDLTVSDSDNSYPSGFTLSVSSGENYSVSGTTITPVAGFSGTLQIPVTVNDGTDSSAPFTLLVTVSEVNTPPVITGQVALSTPEATPITIQLSHLTVNDPDDSYPTGFLLSVSSGTNYTISGTTVTPGAGFSGNLTVPVTVNDGTDNSAPFNLTIAVTDVNTPPVITGQVALSTRQNTPITLQLSNLIVTDPDDSYPAGFTMSVSPGTNYSVSGTTVTPAAGFTGNLSVPVTVNDGTDASAPFNVTITVNAPVNVAPSITGQIPISIVENQSVTIQLSHLTVNDPDNIYPTGFTLTVSPGNNYTVVGNVVTPAQDYTGTLFVRVTVNDGQAESNPFNLSITVSPRQNVAPVITGQVPLSTLKNQPLLIQLSHLTVTDPDNNFPQDFTLSVIGGANYSVAGDIITPAQNFVGNLVVKVTVNDGFVSSAPFNLGVTVNDVVVNQPPVITGQVGLTTFKNTPITISLSHLVVSDPDDTYPTGFTLKLNTGLNYTLKGNTVTPAKDFIGALSVNATVNDGTDNSAPFPVRIQVVEKGELQITGQLPITIEEDSSVVVKLTHLTVSDPQKKYPAGFTLNISPGENYSVEGTTVRPARDFHGNLNVSVTVSNSTGTSPPFNMLMVVTPVNDVPRVDQIDPEPLVYNVGSGMVTVDDALVVTDVDDDILLIAEVGIRPEYYQSGADIIEFNETANIRGVFDAEEGILTLIGSASLEEYTTALRSVRYGFISDGDTTPIASKVLYYRVNDGKMLSDFYERPIEMGEVIVLDIPNVFTPNDDMVNDTWKISASKEDSGDQAVIRVFNERGIKVFEATGLDSEWDGRMNGEYLPADIYYYTIDLNLAYRKSTFKGAVMLIR